MSRQLRIEYTGANYHVMCHGTGKLWLYKNQSNLIDFLDLLIQVKEKYKFEFHTFILMRNHYHLLIETPFANLSKGMNFFNGEYAKRLNLRYKRSGKVFRSRYKAILIEKKNYYNNVYRYINQNALRSNIVEKVEDYMGGIWYHIKRADKVCHLINDLISWDLVFNHLRIYSLTKLKSWLNQEMVSLSTENQKYEYILGTPSWVEKIKKKYIDPLHLPKDFNQKSRIKRASSEIWEKFKKLKQYKNHLEYINIAIYILWKYSNLSQSEIAIKFNLPGSNSVSQRLYQFKKRISKNKELKEIVTQITNEK